MHWTRQLVYFSTSRDRVHRIAVNCSGHLPRRAAGAGRRRARTTVVNETAVELLYQAGSRRAGAGLQLSVDWLYDRLYVADDNTVRAPYRCTITFLRFFIHGAFLRFDVLKYFATFFYL